MPGLCKQAQEHVNYLCNVLQERRVGGDGNRKATTYFKHFVEQQGWQVEETELENMECQEITHTPKDHPGIVNFERLSEISKVIQNFLLKI